MSFLKPATKRQTERAGESSRPDFNDIRFAGHTWLIKQFVWPARRSGDVGITECLKEVLLPSTGSPASADKVSPQLAHTQLSALELPKEMGCHSPWKGRGEGGSESR